MINFWGNMAYQIDGKFVVAMASSALFDLGEADRVFQELGPDSYKKYQEEHINDILKPGVAFPFVKRLLKLNEVFQTEKPVEVILLSKNSAETGLRVFNSIKHYCLDITRGAFLSGISPYPYLKSFNATIFLSANGDDVKSAIDTGHAAGMVIKSEFEDDDDEELRLAFDFDAVIVDDEAERIYKESGSLEEFYTHEVAKSKICLNPGPLKSFIDKISSFQKMEEKRANQIQGYKKILKTAIVTARNAPSHERMVNTLKQWGISVDAAFLMGGVDKKRVLEVLKPHLFFDDQMTHLDSTKIPQVHVPFGIANLKC